MKVTADQLDFLESLIEQGIEIAANHPGMGTFDLRAEEVGPFLADRDLFVANIYGVTKETLLAYYEFRNGFQCLGTTQQGVQCKSQAPNGNRLDDPKLFHPANLNCYCKTHHKQAREKLH